MAVSSSAGEPRSSAPTPAGTRSALAGAGWRGRSRPLGPAVAGALGLVVLLLGVALLAPSAHATPASFGTSRTPNGTTIKYNSSVDKFPLSYLEWLPPRFANDGTFALFVYLHGMGSGTSPVRGGIGGDTVSSDIINAAQTEGVILISINTRTDSGFYENSPCGGPQETDVLDAINHESHLHAVSSVYLVGFSMGSAGAFSIAADHPSLIHGLASVGTITDLFETAAYDSAGRSMTSQVLANACTTSSTNETAEGLAYHVSSARFYPQNFSGVALYVVVGGNDIRAPNNFHAWPYANGNSTFINSTCTIASSLSEPLNCTKTFDALHLATPSSYTFRFVYEGAGAHSQGALPALDAFKFLLGVGSGGFYTTTYPPATLHQQTPPAVPTY